MNPGRERMARRGSLDIRAGSGRLPGSDVWIFARRSLSDAQMVADNLACAPVGTSVETLMRVASTRYIVEKDKGETGPGEDSVPLVSASHRVNDGSRLAGQYLNAPVTMSEETRNTVCRRRSMKERGPTHVRTNDGVPQARENVA